VIVLHTLPAVLLATLAAAGSAETDADIGPKAVADPKTAQACERKAHDTAAVVQCLKDALKLRQPQAVQLIERLKGEGYLHRFAEAGRVDLAWVTYPFRGNATTGVLLVNGTPNLVDVSDPAHYAKLGLKTHASYAAIAKGADVDIWADDLRGAAEKAPGGGQRFRFAFPLKTCRACTPVGTATVAFDFDAAGVFAGTKLVELKAAP